MNVTHRLRAALRSPLDIYRIRHQVARVERDLVDQRVLIGQLLSRLHRNEALARLHEAEFKVFSQYGDDGIISYLVDRVAPAARTFVEFGVETYVEANTRFLLMTRNWSGLVMDGRPDLEMLLRADPVFRRHDLKARSAFVTAENVNDLLAESGFDGELGLLSIDIDGNDYWVWRALRAASPAIVVIEVNSVFGPSNPWTVPYDPAFDRTRYHPSNLAYGSSVTSLCDLADEKGYAFVGCNSAGNNAYFVRRDKLNGLDALTPAAGYVEAAFCESRDARGAWTFLKGRARLASLHGVDVFNTRLQRLEKIP